MDYAPPSAMIRIGNDDLDTGSGGTYDHYNPVSGELQATIPLAGKAEIASSVMFSFELEFGGVFRIRNVPQESLNAVVLIECPRLLFPFAREIIATAVRNGGFPPLLLDPVDFVALYRQKMAQMPAAQAPAQ